MPRRLAVLPWQTARNEFEIPVYVMTSDLLNEHEPGAAATRGCSRSATPGWQDGLHPGVCGRAPA